jgi:hypothetical protein
LSRDERRLVASGGARRLDDGSVENIEIRPYRAHAARR